MAEVEMPLEQTLEHLQCLASKSLALWDVPHSAKARLINVSENTTYLVEADGGYRSVLRVHRESYHTERAIECELDWSKALTAQGGVITPAAYVGLNGKIIQSATIEELPDPRFMVLFHFIEGTEPDEGGDLVNAFEELGEIAARTHLHSIHWTKPEFFERMTWDAETIFGVNSVWGNWRDGPEVDQDIENTLSAVEALVCKRLAAFGKDQNRFGLIHADMRLANLLVGENGTRLIDFDDCGFGWFLYDFATGISFMEDDPRVPDLKNAWVTGYRKQRQLPPEDEAEIETFIMMRRLALLAWIGSHIEAPESQALAPGFARTTADLGKIYLAKYK